MTPCARAQTLVASLPLSTLGLIAEPPYTLSQAAGAIRVLDAYYRDPVEGCWVQVPITTSSIPYDATLPYPVESASSRRRLVAGVLSTFDAMPASSTDATGRFLFGPSHAILGRALIGERDEAAQLGWLAIAQRTDGLGVEDALLELATHATPRTQRAALQVLATQLADDALRAYGPRLRIVAERATTSADLLVQAAARQLLGRVYAAMATVSTPEPAPVPDPPSRAPALTTGAPSPALAIAVSIAAGGGLFAAAVVRRARLTSGRRARGRLH